MKTYLEFITENLYDTTSIETRDRKILPLEFLTLNVEELKANLHSTLATRTFNIGQDWPKYIAHLLNNYPEHLLFYQAGREFNLYLIFFKNVADNPKTTNFEDLADRFLLHYNTINFYAKTNALKKYMQITIADSDHPGQNINDRREDIETEFREVEPLLVKAIVDQIHSNFELHKYYNRLISIWPALQQGLKSIGSEFNFFD